MSINEKILLTNSQHFSLHDGPGIRTTIFLKGCALRCPWCSNPENLSSDIQHYIKDGRLGTYGKYLSVDELYNDIMKDRIFYIDGIDSFDIRESRDIESLPGGVTFSGGECLLQIEKLQPLMDRLQKEHIHMSVESSLFVPETNLKLAIRYIDLFYIDIKILDEENCCNLLRGDLKLYMSNLRYLAGSGKPIVFRVPVIGGYTDGKENRKKVADIISLYVNDETANILKVELIKEHGLGISKYQSLAACNKEYDVPEYKGVTEAVMAEYKDEIEDMINYQRPVEICII